MQQQERIAELIDSFYRDFDEKLADSESVIFSGKFGSGKTYFLNDYFSRNEDKYVMLYTQPSSYYHASDSDPLSYLKYDVLFELLRRVDIDTLKTDDLGNLELLRQMISDVGSEMTEAEATLAAVAMMLVFSAPAYGIGATALLALGKTAWKGTESFSKARKWWAEKLQAANKDDATTVEEYLGGLGARQNSLFEASAINELIFSLLEKLRVQDAQPAVQVDTISAPATEAGVVPRKVVLVVDDLDRMLPDSCLQFLNMLSTHVRPGNEPNEPTTRTNIYSVDKIICVGDINNIHSFIKSKYGELYDSEGYINKLSGVAPYNYDPSVSLSKLVDSKLIRPIANKYATDHTWGRGNQDNFYDIMRQGCIALVQGCVITIRVIEQINRTNLSAIYESRAKYITKYGDSLHPNEHPIVLIAHFLSLVFDGLERAKLAMRADSRLIVDNRWSSFFVGSCLQLLKSSSFSRSESLDNCTIELNGINYVIQEQKSTRIGEKYYCATMGHEETKRVLHNHNAYAILREAILNIREHPLCN